MTPYVKGKVQELIKFMNALSQRQRDIQKEMSGTVNREYKDILNNERTTNTVVLRCAGWIKMTLEGKSLKDKLLVDKEFPLWYRQTRGYYAYAFLAGLFGWDEDQYIWRSKYAGPWHTYFNQRQLFYYIYNILLPDKAPGIFGFQTDDDIECDIWRTTFRELDKKEWEEFKELRGY
jgi:hypothetical protein